MTVVDDYSRFTWVRYLAKKSDAFKEIKELIKMLKIQTGLKVKRIRTDHGGEFENHSMDEFCQEKGIIHEYSASRTP